MSEQVADVNPALRVADEVRAVLARRRVSARQAAFALGWTEHYMSRRTTGKIPFDVNDLHALATVLDVPMRTFFTGLDEDRSEYRKGLGLGSNNGYYSTPLWATVSYPTCANSFRSLPEAAEFSRAA